VGQSYGTTGSFCDPNAEVRDPVTGELIPATENCDFPLQPKLCVEPAANAGNSCSNDSDCDSPGGAGDGVCTSRVQGVLGGTQVDGSGYQAPEVKQRLEALAPCLKGSPGKPFGTCLDLNPVGTTREANLALLNAAKLTVARELAEELDSQPWAGDFNRTGPTTNDVWGGYLKGDIVLPWGMQLTSITSYDNYDRFFDLDLDFSPETLFQIVTDDDGWQVTQNLQLQGELGDASPLRWDIGGWFLREQLNVVVTNNFGANTNLAIGTRDYVQDLWSVGSYASLAFDFWRDFTLDGGVRYNWERKKLDYTLVTGVFTKPILENLDETWDAPTGTIRLTYRFREDTHIFWKYTRGFKPGTYNATSSLGQGVSVADAEQIDAFEAGVRGSWFQGRMGLDFSVFYYSYDDYQLFTAQQFSGGQPEFVILNAPEAEVYGAEVDAVGRPWTGAFLNVRFGWLESQFLDYVQIQQEIVNRGGAQVTINRELQNTGNSLLNSPEFKVSLTAEQVFPLGRWGSFTARYDAVWTDTSYYDATEGRGIPNVDNVQFMPEDTIAQPAFWVHNFRLGYRPPSGRFEIAGWVRNFTDEAFKTFAFDASTFNNTSIYFVGDPRTYGLSLNLNF
jgi:iron complex outermembrane receptor protein